MTLKEYLDRLLARVRKAKFAGAILHLNKLELLERDDPRQLTRFFDESRDSLQTQHVYFIFVGYTGMFQEIIVPVERVRSIFFGHPVHLPPLGKQDVHRAIKLRYRLLSLKKNRWIAPVNDELVDHLYDVFAGKIRFIMDSITTLVTRLPEGVTGTLSAVAAREMLQQLAWERIRSVLTDTEQGVLAAAVNQPRPFHQFVSGEGYAQEQTERREVPKTPGKLELCLSGGETGGRSVYYETSPELALLRAD